MAAARRPTTAQALALRARLVLRCAAGETATLIAGLAGLLSLISPEWSLRATFVVFGAAIGLSALLVFAGFNLVLNRFTGPGRLGLQSMYLHMGESV